MRKDSVLILRTCNADGTSYGGFQWPLEVGVKVEAQDWNSAPCCGGGLHGLLWGIGDHTLMDLSPTARGIVFEAPVKGVVDIDGAKCKVQRGTVRFVGTLDEATAWINERSAPNAKGYRGTATAGYRGTATAGDLGVVAIHYWNDKRYKVRVATVKDADGDGELEPNTPYKLDDAGNWVVAK